ncbi:MAG: metallophosphoesterase [Sedimentisphaerales bacterium]|nr:metallophosphoesterase [Sedimentisphaerales bacterium]
MTKRYSLITAAAILALAVLAGKAAEYEPWRFVVTADSRSEGHSDHNGVNVAILSELVQETIDCNAEFVLFGGDLVIGSSDQATLEEEFLTWRETAKPLYEAGIGVYIVRGNHDEGTYPSGIDAWNNVFKYVPSDGGGGIDYGLPKNGPEGELNLTYAVRHKNVLALGLDQCRTANHSKNYVHQAWIDEQLAGNTLPHVFAYGHFTCFKMIWDSVGDHPTSRDAFWESLKNAGSRAYFCGHEHFYNHSRVDDDGLADNDFHQQVVGSAGASIHNWNGTFPGDNSGRNIANIYHTTLFGYCIVDINDLDVTITWMERHTSDPSVAGIYSEQDSWSYRVQCGDFGHPHPAADINRDCRVDGRDLALMTAHWRQAPGDPAADVAPEVRDNFIDLRDLAVLVQNWLECTDPRCL